LDHSVSLNELTRFCESLDINDHDDIVAGALSTLLFWGMGRVFELIHSSVHPRKRWDSIREIEHDSGIITFRIFLEYPKVQKDCQQFITPSYEFGITNANRWLLIIKLCDDDNTTSPWQLENGAHATSEWLNRRIEPYLRDSNESLGVSSFQAGGYSRLASMGHDLTLLRVFGWWSTDAADNYLRDHPEILVANLHAKSALKHAIYLP
jgi:hypothetical protein